MTDPKQFAVISETGQVIHKTDDYREAAQVAEGEGFIWSVGMAVYTINANFPYEEKA